MVRFDFRSYRVIGSYLLLVLGFAGLAPAYESESPGYEADGRPDPFLPRITGDPEPPCPEQRPKIQELEISGVFLFEDTRVAQARAGARDYLLREGDRLCDGSLASIDADGVVMRRKLEGDVEVDLASSASTTGGRNCFLTATDGRTRLSCRSELVILPPER